MLPWFLILLCDLLIPITMITAGVLFIKRCPKDINNIFGYRTPRSMKNMDTWKFAHTYCGRLWCVIGLISLLLTVLIHLPFNSSDIDTLGNVSLIVMGVQCVILIVSIFPTEIALKRNFNDDGTKK